MVPDHRGCREINNQTSHVGVISYRKVHSALSGHPLFGCYSRPRACVDYGDAHGARSSAHDMVTRSHPNAALAAPPLSSAAMQNHRDAHLLRERAHRSVKATPPTATTPAPIQRAFSPPWVPTWVPLTHAAIYIKGGD